MSAETSAATVAPEVAAPRSPWAVLTDDERRFYFGLACAVLLHALLLVGVIGFASVSPDEVRRRIGNKGGELEGVSIELVTDADFRNRESVPLDGGPPPAEPREATERAQTAKSAPQPAERAAEQQQAEPQPAQKQTAAALARESPELLTLPDVTGRPQERPVEKREARPQPQQQQQQPQQRPETRPQRPNLNAALPPQPSQNHASFSRPAGITRSGENDDFARGVIRALRATMPPGRGNLGRVTIRFLLSENGNLAEVSVVATSANGALTQDVVFSSRQSNFPFPPKGATVADRTFLVTYIYE